MPALRLSWGHRSDSVSIRKECFNKYASKEEMMKQYVKLPYDNYNDVKEIGL